MRTWNDYKDHVKKLVLKQEKIWKKPRKWRQLSLQ